MGLSNIYHPKEGHDSAYYHQFSELNKRIVRRSYPIPKISTRLQELEGFTYAMALVLNMGNYTIIFPWGKYSYLQLPMGYAGSADIFQADMMDLMEALEYVRAYIDDLLNSLPVSPHKTGVVCPLVLYGVKTVPPTRAERRHKMTIQRRHHTSGTGPNQCRTQRRHLKRNPRPIV